MQMQHHCLKCGAVNEINWIEDLPFPKEPIPVIDNTGYWVPASIPVRCVQCETHTDLAVPKIETESTWTLYGDEAGRIVKHKDQELSFFCLSIVGLHNTKHDIARTRLNKLKKISRPDIESDEWTHHFTKIWSESGERRIYDLKNVGEKIKYGQRLSRMINSLKPELFSYNFSSAIILPADKTQKKIALKSQKEDIFKQAILGTLRVLRENKKSVRWVFDNIQDTTDGTKTEGWANECFLGLQYTRLFTYLCAGSAVHAPEFVTPGSHFLLEIADYISFCMGREFHMVASDKNSELPCGLMGHMLCQLVDAQGNTYSTMENPSLSIRRYFLGK